MWIRGFCFLKVKICCGHVWYRFLIDITCEILSYEYAKFVLLSLGATSSYSHITRSQMQNDFRMILDSRVGLFSCLNITDQSNYKSILVVLENQMLCGCTCVLQVYLQNIFNGATFEYETLLSTFWCWKQPCVSSCRDRKTKCVTCWISNVFMVLILSRTETTDAENRLFGCRLWSSCLQGCRHNYWDTCNTGILPNHFKLSIWVDLKNSLFCSVLVLLLYRW